ncbi:MAG: hypothetical protein U9N86_09195, partial [Bacteroidota bacterium]|nr:hypothetical protein [Bacteroidota bacterium]
KNKLLREMFVALETPNERLAVLNLTDLIFKLANEEFQRQDFDLIEPEYLEKVKYLFDNAAMTAQFLRGGLK